MYISHQAITFISFSNPLLADSDVIFGIGFFGNLGEGRKQCISLSWCLLVSVSMGFHVKPFSVHWKPEPTGSSDKSPNNRDEPVSHSGMSKFLCK